MDALIDYRGKSPPKSATGVPVISAKVVKGGRVEQPVEQTIAPSYYNEWMRRGLPSVGDVVMTTEGPLGEVAQLDEQTAKFALGQRIVTMRGRPGVLHNGFFKFLLQSPDVQHRLASRATGTTVLGISQQALREMPIPLPSWREQESIAETLSSLDDKIELNRRMNETLEAMAQAIFRDWFVDFGPVRRKLEGATDPVKIMGGVTTDTDEAARLAALFPAALGDDGLPEGWEETSVGEIATIKGGKQLPKTDFIEFGNVPVFGGAGKMGFTDKHNADGYVITVGRVGAYCGQFFSHRGAAWVNNNASQIVPGEMTPPEWLFLALKQLDIETIKKGAAQPFVSNGDIAALGLAWPTSDVLGAYQKLAKPLVQKQEAAATENETLADLRDLLLPKLMSGEIRLQRAAE